MKNYQHFSKVIYQAYLQKKKNNGEPLSLRDLAIIALTNDGVESEEFQNFMSKNPNLEPNFLKKLDLTGLILTGANLEGDDLSGGFFLYTNLSRANLRRANLSEANLSEADLSNADLTGANLNGVILLGTDLTKANLSEADLTKAILNKIMLFDANLSNAKLTKASLRGGNLSRANLRNADLRKADLMNADLKNADLSNADLTGANLLKTDLTRAIIFQADFTGVIENSINNRNLEDSDFDPNIILYLLEPDRLDKTQLSQILGIGDEVPASKYLQNLINELGDGREVIPKIQKVFERVKLCEEKIANPSPNPQPKIGNSQAVNNVKGPEGLKADRGGK